MWWLIGVFMVLVVGALVTLLCINRNEVENMNEPKHRARKKE